MKSLKSTPVTQGLRVGAPGFVLIDGRWYVFSGPYFGSTLSAFPMGPNAGFVLAGWASSRNCRAEPAPPNVPPTFSVQEGANVLVSFPMFPGNQSIAEIRVGHCQNSNIIAVASRSGRLICDGQVEQPYTVQECPVLSRMDASTDIFINGFE